MSIKYKNKDGLNEKKSNQSSMNSHFREEDLDIDERKFNNRDQERVEQHAGEGGETSGESFDKYPSKK
ncbi:MAG: hypothetical protein CME63_17265 [Halobacteriovoraceae bacterium]|nr:hypothetical protein [Halobacteriovoraceae bacterium]|tara:strand:+ start:213545 stop:213748 length:204 start_codon:yes stop_codon:yes gene_type:complete